MYAVRRADYIRFGNETRSIEGRLAEDAVRACRDRPSTIPPSDDCLKSEIIKLLSADAQKKDLWAQQEMAYWAFMTFIVGAVSVVISSAALLGLFLSLRQTRLAISNDRQIGNAQVRAYLSVEFGESAGPAGGPYQFKIINSGQSPATHVRYIAGQLILEHPLVDVDDLITVASDQTIPLQTLPAGQHIVGDAQFQTQPSTSEYQIIKSNGAKRIYLVVRIFYKDTFDQDHETRFCAFSDASPHEENGVKMTKFHWILADRLNDMS